MTKFWPYKLYCLFGFGAGIGGVLDIADGGVFTVHIPSLASYLKLPASRLRSYLEDCDSYRLITNLKLVRGMATFRLQPPLNIDKSPK